MKGIISLLGTLFFIISCGAPTDNKLYDEVMFIHDEVMPKMSDISKLGKEIKKKKQELSDSTLIAIYDDHIKALNEADEAMYDWMHEFELPDQESDVEPYLIKEKDRIQKVSDMMLSSIANAQKLLDEN